MNKKVKIFLGAVLLLTAGIAMLHLTTRDTIPAGQLQIVCDGKESSVALSDLKLVSVQGTISNAKGEKRTIDAQGVPVRDVASAANAGDYSKITVVADDEYRAELTADEIASEGNAYFILQEAGGIQLIVFSDNNSKRNVSNVVRVELS